MFSYEFPRPAVTVDLVALSIIGRTLSVLLVKRDAEPFAGQFALPGGFVHEDEPLESSALRVLDTKACIERVYMEQLATFGAPERDPRGRIISIAYIVVVPEDYQYDGDGAWHAFDQIPSLAFDHEAIVAVALQRVRAKLEYSDLGLRFMPVEFTLTHAQRTFEAILNRPLDKRNFRKALLAKGVVAETGHKSTGGAHPPAKFYSHAELL